MITCSFCGYEFSELDSQVGCQGCPLHKSCGKVKCPNCGFEIPKEPKLISWLKKKRREKRE
jgi:hypothetical protein